MTDLEIAGATVAAIIIAAQFVVLRMARDQLKSGTEKLAAAIRWIDALTAIAAATETGKSGTARKVHRMAKEAIDG